MKQIEIDAMRFIPKGMTINQVRRAGKHAYYVDIKVAICNGLYPKYTIMEIGNLPGLHHATVIHHLKRQPLILLRKREYLKKKIQTFQEQLKTVETAIKNQNK